MSVLQNQLGHFLYQAGWLPIEKPIDFARDGDLLPSVQKAWEHPEITTVPPDSRRRNQGIRSWLQEQITNGAQLTSLSSESPRATHWLGERLLWWPHGQPTGSRVGIASSRLGRRLDTQTDWFKVFRAAYAKINRGRDVVLTAVATTPDRYVRRAAELFDVRVVSITCPRNSEPIQAWFTRIRRLNSTPAGPVLQAYLSPELLTPPDDSARPVTLSELPLRDRAVVSMAEQLLVFHLRHDGHLEKLVRARLNDLVWPKASVFIALGEDLVDRGIADDFLDRGAVGWVVLDTLRNESAPRTPSSAGEKAPIVELPSSDNWRWLTHCTRAQSDGWPDQRRVDYLDELLLNRDLSDRSAFAAVQRIVATRRLVATSRMIRGDTDVVCFTAVPLRDLPALRSFRSHLARWDFEPYGICICRDWLAERGCLPVRYGDESLWQSLAAEDRPFFQVRTSRSRRSGRSMDWSSEREWRHVGDVNLGELPSEAGLVFVATWEEAEQLATISRWPVTVLG